MRIDRADVLNQVRRSIRANPVTVLYGPRQCGKTTVAREIASASRAEYFDLEDPVSERRLSEPMLALRSLRGLIVIDEVQRRPDLFPALRVLADRNPLPARFLILGSASPELLRQGSESLAGRIALIEMSGFNISETGSDAMRKLWWRGGFPRAYLARTDRESRIWQQNFVRTFIERDIQEFGVRIPPVALRRLWTMLAHYHANICNTTELSRALGEAHTTVKRHIELLVGALVVRQISPWHENLSKRQVKAPKLYVRDSGLLHALLDVPSFRDLDGNPKVGASWEGFAVEEIVRLAGERNVYFWNTYSGAELDLLVMRSGKRYGVEMKYKDAPSITKSMRVAMQDLGLDRLFVLYPGDKTYDLDKDIVALPLAEAQNHF
jgi:uncharacterized protein